jgi:hypothetical protein
MPPDPFHGPDVPDMGGWASNIYGFYSALIAAGFPESRAFELTDSFLVTSMQNAAMQGGAG